MKENNDCIRGRRLTDIESLYFMLPEIPDYSETINEVCKPFIEIKKENENKQMSLNIKEDENHVLGRKYNVEYLDGRDRCQTFNNTLINVDGTYFWFEDVENGLACVKQDRVTFMYCTDRLHRQENKIDFNSHMTRERIGKIDDCFKWRNKTFSIKESLIQTCRFFNLYYSHSLYEIIINDKDTTEDNFMRMYLKCINNLLQYKGKTFKNSDF